MTIFLHFFVCISNFLFPPSFPQMFWWFSRTNETYAFLPRVSWVGTSRISGRRFWGSWETLHAALETRARQYWCAFITVVYTLPVSKAGQVGDVGCLLVTAASGCWAWKMTLKYLNLKIFPVPGFNWATNTHLLSCPPVICSAASFPSFGGGSLLSVWLGTFSRFFHLRLMLS